jgi:hypothetical protein
VASKGSNVHVASEECKTTTMDLRRIIDIIQTLNFTLEG